ncbi:MAG: inner-rane translocator [Chloroflexi bacterium]|jgi:ribose transport system permease protein|nr:inner-rane translocator [Chloroflexota bacterium]MDB5076985.1 inner-rane translocator [Chloroflexota bacterium]
MSAPTQPEPVELRPAAPPSSSPLQRWLRAGLGANNLYILLVLIALMAFFSLISPNHAFFGTSNFLNIVWDSAETLLLAIGETFVIITAGIDLSVGTVLMVSGVSAAWVMAQTAGTPAQVTSGHFPHAGQAIILGIIAGLGVGLLAGAINGILITRLRLPAFIVTLGVFSVANGLGDLISSSGAAGQNAIPPVPDRFANSFGSGNLILGLPTLVFVSALAAIIAHIVLTRTIFGRRTFAVGSNLEGSRLSGVPVNMHVFLVYVLCGFMSGLAGIFDLARYQTVDIAGHSLDNLNAIAAVVIGGTSLFGGTGSIVGTVIGAFIPTVLRYGFTIQGVSSFWQDVVVGLIIIVAVFIDQVRRQRTT